MTTKNYIKPLFKIMISIPNCIILMLFTSHATAEIEFSGFLSVGAGQVISNNTKTHDDTFIADYSNAGKYESNTSFRPDTTAGIQAQSHLLENISMNTQIIGQGNDNFNAELDWLYLTYEFHPSAFLEVGRKRLPLYYYSEFFDVGYAYVWVRPPVDNYTWQINHYNGVSLRQHFDINDMSGDITLYYGREDSKDNPILGELYKSAVDETWREMYGVVFSLSESIWDIRLNFLNGRNDRTLYGYKINPSTGEIVESEDTQLTFKDYEFTNYGASLNLDTAYGFLLTEYNIRNREKDPQIQTYLVSIGARWNTWALHLTFSEFKQDKENNGNKAEEHNTKSIGVRWDFHTSAAVKLQFDHFDDTGGLGYEVGGDSQTVSTSLDMVF